MITKRYKTINNKIEYFEVWQDENELCFHKGVLGTQGALKIIEYSKQEIEVKYNQAILFIEGLGYSEIPDSKHTEIYVELKGDFILEDYITQKLDKLIDQKLGWTGNGIVLESDLVFDYIYI